jgi:MFS family permease
MMGAIFYVPLLMQGVLGSSATFAGSLLSPMMFALMIVPPIASKAITAVRRYRILGALAMALVAGGLFLLSTVDTGSGRGSTVVAMILLGIGIGISFPMATIVVQSAVAKEMIGVGTSQMQFWRMIAGPVSLALKGSILSLQLGRDATAADSVPPAQLADALHTVFLTAAIIVLIGFVATLLLKEVPVRAMPSMMRRKKKPPTGAADADAAPAPQATEEAAGAPGTMRRTEAGEA